MLDPKVKIRIDGYVYSRNGKIRLRGINTSAKLGNNLSIRYVASTNAKEPYEVYWQVVNTGEHARRENGLRGNFFRAKAHGGTLNSNKLSNWEYSKYKGLHWIEAFVVKDGYLIARSGRFYVHINNPSF